MASIDTLDIFIDNPFLAFKNAGSYTYNRIWSWKSKVPYTAIYCVTQGHMQLQLDEQIYIAGAGDVLFVRSSDVGIISNTTDENLSYCFISFYYDESTDLKIDTLLHDAGVEPLVRKILQAHRSNAPRSRLQVNYLFLQLIYQLATQSAHRQKRPEVATKLQAAVEYINIHYDQKITVQQLGQLTGYSEAHLRRLFIQNLDLSPIEYIQKKRIEAAKELLLDDPNRSLDEISHTLGICSSSYFCKLFKQLEGVTPAAFREEKKGKSN